MSSSGNGNQTFGVQNTNVDYNKVLDALESVNVDTRSLRQVRLICTPTAVGTYALTNEDGSAFAMSPTDIILRWVTFASSDVAGATAELVVGQAATNGGAVATAQSGAAAVITGFATTPVVSAVAPALAAAEPWVSATITVAPVTAGEVHVFLELLNTRA